MKNKCSDQLSVTFPWKEIVVNYTVSGLWYKNHYIQHKQLFLWSEFAAVLLSLFNTRVSFILIIRLSILLLKSFLPHSFDCQNESPEECDTVLFTTGFHYRQGSGEVLSSQIDSPHFLSWRAAFVVSLFVSFAVSFASPPQSSSSHLFKMWWISAWNA